MLSRLVHRGPDDQGQVDFAGGWLGHTRLSIVDVTGGHQPLSSSEGDRWLVGNGEIYNHEQVRGRLGDGGYATRSDNEVALRLLERRGPDALGELEGMYAFLSATATGDSFVAARDPVGIKPLYWARRDEEVRFASEIAAFDAAWRPAVEAFPPGCHWTPEQGLRRFAKPVPADGLLGTGAEPGADDLQQTRETLIASVHRQMMGDVPVGVFLSGGLDSTLIAAIAARYYAERGERLKTFAVGTADSPDLLAARQAAEYLGTEHHERLYTAQEALDVVAPVVRAIEHFDPSLVRSAVPNFLLAEMTARHVKVVLTGEGADELFAGYRYFHELSDPDELHDELIRSVQGLHNLNLQRCDRVTMAHGLEARVPFLDRQVIALALRLPAAWKVAGPDVPEKRLLRQAFTGWLPSELLWREKSQFGDGSGAASVLTEALEASITAEELAAEADAVDPPLRTREELAYYRIWSEHLRGVRPGPNLGRFATA
ncbi:MAG: asparagine synthase (glutamine-hydrolyzing) [Actinomycetota bacterium]|nr:asparagine synthase (glutamine-hydrolyzing) [Actinomycetota bacterium]